MLDSIDLTMYTLTMGIVTKIKFKLPLPLFKYSVKIDQQSIGKNYFFKAQLESANSQF